MDMNTIERFARDLQRLVPDAELPVRQPGDAEGMWWLDATRAGRRVTVQWSPKRGFGISASLLPDGYGEGPEEVFAQPALALARVVALLNTDGSTTPPPAVAVRELRAIVGLTQGELAARMGVQQAAVSRFERREDVTLSTLRRYVRALGAQLEISMRTEAGRRFVLSPPTPYTPAKKSSRVADAPLAPYAAFSRAGAQTQAWRRSLNAAATVEPIEGAPRLQLLVLRVACLERSYRFYSELGLSLEPERHAKGPLHYAAVMPSGVFELYPASEARPVTKGLRLGFALPCDEARLARLKTAQLLSAPPRWSEGGDAGQRQVLIDDPDGNTICLAS
ncbi:MAG: helix-turn-helix domain-containing protein [Polyangiales bacterium]